MNSWNRAAGSRTLKIRSLSRLVPGYGYSTPEHAHKTDEIFCSVLVQNFRTAKAVMFNVLETAYEMHRELLLKDFEAFRDAMDVLSDQIKARAFRWDDDKDEKWLGRLVDYDYRILTGMGNLLTRTRDLEKAFLASEGSVSETQDLDSMIKALKEELSAIETMFQERDVICNIGNEALEETFEEKRTEIERGV